MNTTQEAILDKVVSLLAQTVERGATLAEQQAAMRHIKKLMTEHGIDENAVMAAQVLKEGAKGPCQFAIRHDYYVCARARKYDYDNNVCMILKECFNVQILWSTHTHPEVKGWCHAYLVIGDELDVAIAKAVIPLLLEAMRGGVNRLLKELSAREGREVKWTATVGRSYYDGVTCGYIEGSEAGAKAARATRLKNDSDAYALVLVDKAGAITAYKENTFKITPARNAPTRYSHDDQAFARGFQDGKNLDVDNSNKLK